MASVLHNSAERNPTLTDQELFFRGTQLADLIRTISTTLGKREALGWRERLQSCGWLEKPVKAERHSPGNRV
jgi:hypothetical protein